MRSNRSGRVWEVWEVCRVWKIWGVGGNLTGQGDLGGVAVQGDLGCPRGWERAGVTRLSRRWGSGAGLQGLAGTAAYAGQRKLTDFLGQKHMQDYSVKWIHLESKGTESQRTFPKRQDH